VRTIATLCLALALAGSAAGQAGAALGRICPDPARPCAGFRAHDLSFVLPADGAARAEDRSAPFYAVILRTAGRCAVGERERLAAQAAFPGRKVFATRWECDGDVENNVTYTGVDVRYGFLAVYAGESRALADAALARVKATGRFPGANLRRMQVVRVHP
jgi:hypothetical protein